MSLCMSCERRVRGGSRKRLISSFDTPFFRRVGAVSEAQRCEMLCVGGLESVDQCNEREISLNGVPENTCSGMVGCAQLIAQHDHLAITQNVGRQLKGVGGFAFIRQCNRPEHAGQRCDRREIVGTFLADRPGRIRQRRVDPVGPVPFKRADTGSRRFF
jgi:hypothetical protein